MEPRKKLLSKIASLTSITFIASRALECLSRNNLYVLPSPTSFPLICILLISCAGFIWRPPGEVQDSLSCHTGRRSEGEDQASSQGRALSITWIVLNFVCSIPHVICL